MATSGTKSTTLYNTAYPSQYPFTLKVDWKRNSVNHVTNSSNITVTATLSSSTSSFDTSNNNTLQVWWNDDNTFTSTTLVDEINVQDLKANSSAKVTGTFDVKHKADGTLKVYALAKWNRVSSSGNYTPLSGTAYSPTVQLDPTYVGGPTTTLTENSKTYNTISLNWKTNQQTNQYRYKLNGGSWVTLSGTGTALDVSGGGTIIQNITGLTPNTKYTIVGQSQRLVNLVWGAETTIAITTNKPNAPTLGTFTKGGATQDGNSIYFGSASLGTGAPSGTTLNAQYKINNGAWVDIGAYSNDLRYMLTGLSSGTTYTAYGRVVDGYGTPSAEKSLTFTTLPKNPVLDTFAVSNIGPTTAVLTFSGTVGSGHTGTPSYQIKRVGDASWTTVTSPHTLTGLTPSTTYGYDCRMLDAFNQASVSKGVTFTTQTDQAKLRLKVSSTWSTGKAYYKENNSWLKVKGVYYKQNGAWSKGK